MSAKVPEDFKKWMIDITKYYVLECEKRWEEPLIISDEVKEMSLEETRERVEKYHRMRSGINGIPDDKWPEIWELRKDDWLYYQSSGMTAEQWIKEAFAVLDASNA